MVIFTNLIFIWLLSLTASSTVIYDQNHTISYVTEETSNRQPTTHESYTQSSDVSDLQKSSAAHVKVDQSTSATDTASRQMPQFTAFLSNIYSTEGSNDSAPSLSTTISVYNSTEPQFKDTVSPTNAATNQASSQFSVVSSMLTSSGQKQTTEKTSEFTSDESIQTSTSPIRSTELISTSTTSTKPVENKSMRTNPINTPTDVYKTSPVTTKPQPINTSNPKKREIPAQNNSQNGGNHGKIVAGIIGGALLLMMVGFIFIYVKKRKIKRQQILTKDWAGPSPFLDSRTDNDEVILRSSNRISISSFLPQRLSRRLSLLPEEDQEMEDITEGTTFGGKHQKVSLAPEVTKNGQESNGTTAAVTEMKSTGNATENSVSSSQTNEPPCTDTNSKATDLNENHPPKPPTQSGATGDSLV